MASPTTPYSWASYLRWMLATLVACVALVGAVNVFIDPLGIFGSPRIAGLSATKPHLDHHRAHPLAGRPPVPQRRHLATPMPRSASIPAPASPRACRPSTIDPGSGAWPCAVWLAAGHRLHPQGRAEAWSLRLPRRHQGRPLPPPTPRRPSTARCWLNASITGLRIQDGALRAPATPPPSPSAASIRWTTTSPRDNSGYYILFRQRARTPQLGPQG
jgi:hypothetical protein